MGGKIGQTVAPGAPPGQGTPSEQGNSKLATGYWVRHPSSIKVLGYSE